MPGDEKGAGAKSGENKDMGDALVGAVHAVQDVRRAGRAKAAGLVKDAARTVGKVADALAEL